MLSYTRGWTLRKEKRHCVPIGGTETPSGKGRTKSQNGEGYIWKRNDRRGESIENMKGILHGADG